MLGSSSEDFSQYYTDQYGTTKNFNLKVNQSYSKYYIQRSTWDYSGLQRTTKLFKRLLCARQITRDYIHWTKKIKFSQKPVKVPTFQN